MCIFISQIEYFFIYNKNMLHYIYVSSHEQSCNTKSLWYNNEDHYEHFILFQTTELHQKISIIWLA